MKLRGDDDSMAEPPNPTRVIETLHSMGLSDAQISCGKLAHGWRIRAAGGSLCRSARIANSLYRAEIPTLFAERSASPAGGR